MTSETVAGPPGADALAAPARVSQRSRLRIRTHRTKSSVKFLRGEGSDWLRTEERSERRQQEGAQERRQPPQEEVEVEAGGGEDGVDAVAVLGLEVVAVHAMVGLEVADHPRRRRAVSSRV